MKTEEPRRHRVYMIFLALCALGTVPFWYPDSLTRTWLGIPIWLLGSLLFTALLSGLVAYGIMRFWQDDHLE